MINQCIPVADKAKGGPRTYDERLEKFLVEYTLSLSHTHTHTHTHTLLQMWGYSSVVNHWIPVADKAKGGT